MKGGQTPKAKGKGPFTDSIFMVLFVLMLMTVLFGQQGCVGLAKIFSLGEGWPELLQGSLGFLFLILLAIRAIQIATRARK